MPDPKLIAVRQEIADVLRKHDVGGIVILNSSSHMEYLVQLDTTWTAIRTETRDDGAEGVRFRLTKADVPDEVQRKQLAKDTIGAIAGTLDVMKYLLEKLDDLLAHAAQSIKFAHISRREDAVAAPAQTKSIGYPPGVWEENGELHFNAKEVLEGLGVPVTPENERDFIETAKKYMRERFPNLPLVETGVVKFKKDKPK